MSNEYDLEEFQNGIVDAVGGKQSSKDQVETSETSETNECGRKEDKRNRADNEYTDSEGDGESESEYEEVDVSDNPLYQVLSAFFETDDGKNICDLLSDIRVSIDRNTQVLLKVNAMRHSTSSHRRDIQKK